MATLAPGFYGKLPSHGDFIRRRLGGAFIGLWDSWLQAAMASSKEQLGAQWLDIYLSSPLWRFVFAPGVCGPNMTTGVLMPSVDKAGRCFPLTLAVHLSEPVNPLPLAAEYDDWFSRAESILLSALDDSMPFDLDVFDVQVESCALELDAQAGLAAGSDGSVFPGSQKSWHIGISAADHLDASLRHLHWMQLRDQFNPMSLWWTNGSAQAAPSCLLCEGIPPADSFAAMLDGSWAARRWPSIALESVRRQAGPAAAVAASPAVASAAAEMPAGEPVPEASLAALASSTAAPRPAEEVPGPSPAAAGAAPTMPASTPYIPEFDPLEGEDSDDDLDLTATELAPPAVPDAAVGQEEMPRPVPAAAAAIPPPSLAVPADTPPPAPAGVAESPDAELAETLVLESPVLEPLEPLDPLDALETLQPSGTPLDPLEALGLTEPGSDELSELGQPDVVSPADIEDVGAEADMAEDTVPAAVVPIDSAGVDAGPGSDVVYSSAAVTRAGAGREFNEDAVLERSDMALWAVADGSGGHWVGDVASQAVISELRTVTPADVLGDLGEALKGAMRRAHRYLQQNLDADIGPGQAGGAAVAVFVAVERMSACLSIGPVRLYRIRNGSVEQLTPDGDSEPRLIGHDGELLIDSQYHQSDAGDWYILCSQGVYDVLNDAELASVAVASSPEDACEHLVSSAMSRGADTDMSVAVIHAAAPD